MTSVQSGVKAAVERLEEVEATIIHNLRIRGMRSHDVPAVQDVFAALDEWKAIADREFANRTAARGDATKFRNLLGELLAIIHRDGGHYVEEVGIEQAASEAMLKVAALSSQASVMEEMAKGLDGLQDVFAHDGEDSLCRFERLAEMFRKDTGYLAPGKDPGMLSCQPDGEELRAIYDGWFVAKVTRARTALSQYRTLTGVSHD